MELSPRWSAGGIRHASVVLHFPSTEWYQAYTFDQRRRRIRCTITGCAAEVVLRLLVPAGYSCPEAMVNGQRTVCKQTVVGSSKYVELDLSGGTTWEVICELQTG